MSRNIQDEVLERFVKDVADHKMTVRLDQANFRHITFKKPGSGDCHFHLTTWPGYLCFTGDCGSYVFCRAEDMFAFFRMKDTDFNNRKDGQLSINPGYWAEKVEAQDKRAPVMVWSEDLFRANVGNRFNEMEFSDRQEKKDAWEIIKEEFFGISFDNGFEALQAIYDFDDSRSGLDGIFEDFWETENEEFSFRYIWCCYAITWGIEQYDKAKAEEAKSHE